MREGRRFPCVLALSGAAVVSQSTFLSPGPQTWLRKLHRRGVTIGHNSANKEREGYEADQAHDQDHHNIDHTEWRSGYEWLQQQHDDQADE